LWLAGGEGRGGKKGEERETFFLGWERGKGLKCLSWVSAGKGRSCLEKGRQRPRSPHGLCLLAHREPGFLRSGGNFRKNGATTSTRKRKERGKFYPGTRNRDDRGCLIGHVQVQVEGKWLAPLQWKGDEDPFFRVGPRDGNPVPQGRKRKGGGSRKKWVDCYKPGNVFPAFLFRLCGRCKGGGASLHGMKGGTFLERGRVYPAVVRGRRRRILIRWGEVLPENDGRGIGEKGVFGIKGIREKGFRCCPPGGGEPSFGGLSQTKRGGKRANDLDGRFRGKMKGPRKVCGEKKICPSGAKWENGLWKRVIRTFLKKGGGRRVNFLRRQGTFREKRKEGNSNPLRIIRTEQIV